VGAVVLLVAVSGLAGCEVRPHHDFVVNVGTDGLDAAPGDGVCEMTSGAGDCSLRAAVRELNVLVAVPGVDPTATITLEVDVTLTRSEPEVALRSGVGDLDLLVGDGSATIVGNGHVLDAGGIDRAIELGEGTLTIDGLVVTGGAPAEGQGGGAVRTASSTNLVIVGSTFEDNRILSTGVCHSQGATFPSSCPPADHQGGGAIESRGALVVDRSTFVGNAASSNRTCESSGQGSVTCSYATGGAIKAGGNTLIVRSTFDANSLSGFGLGPAVVTSGSVVHSTITDNVGGGGFGGFFFPGQVYGPTMRSSILLDTDCPTVSVDAQGNLRNSGCSATGNPGVGPLGDHGGPTPTRLLIPGSPAGTLAIDAVAPDPDGTCAGLTEDQRGQARPAGPACDLGSVERQPTDP
jgi:hypothetical protein